jgi:transposase
MNRQNLPRSWAARSADAAAVRLPQSWLRTTLFLLPPTDIHDACETPGVLKLLFGITDRVSWRMVVVKGRWRLDGDM